jgi:phosphoglycolate phosphatase
MVGDTTFDVDMALRAHVRAIGVAWGYHPAADLRRQGAHAMIDSYDELPGAIDRVLGETAS